MKSQAEVAAFRSLLAVARLRLKVSDVPDELLEAIEAPACDLWDALRGALEMGDRCRGSGSVG